MSDPTIEERIERLEKAVACMDMILEERRKAYASLVNGVSNRLLVLEAKCDPSRVLQPGTDPQVGRGDL